MVASASNPIPWTARARLFALVLALLHVTLAWSFRVPVIATAQDDAEYVLLSRELSRGHYADSYDVDAPRHARYPPGYPAFLAAISSVAGERESVFLAANVALTAGALFLFLVLARQHLTTTAWSGLAVVLALNPETIYVAGRVFSEPLFLMLTYATLWAEGSATMSRRPALATALAALTTLARSAGLAIALGLIGARLMERRWKAAIVMIAAVSLTGGMWVLYTARAPRPDERALYSADFRRVLTLEDRSMVESAVERVKYKVEELTADELPVALAVPTFPGTWIDNAIGGVLIVMLLPLGLFQLWKRWRTAAFVLMGYGALYMVWPYGQVRLIIPAIPLILLAMFMAAEYLAARFRRHLGLVLPVGALGVYLLVGAMLRLVRDRDELGTCRKGNAPYAQPDCYPNEGDWAFVQAARFARDSLPPNAIVFTVKAPSFYYHSGRRTVNPSVMLAEDSTTIVQSLRTRGTEWVVTSNAGPDRRRLGVLVASACEDFALVKQFDDRTMVLRLREPSTDGAGDACHALSAWRNSSEEEPRRNGSVPTRNESHLASVGDGS